MAFRTAVAAARAMCSLLRATHCMLLDAPLGQCAAQAPSALSHKGRAGGNVSCAMLLHVAGVACDVSMITEGMRGLRVFRKVCGVRGAKNTTAGVTRSAFFPSSTCDISTAACDAWHLTGAWSWRGARWSRLQLP